MPALRATHDLHVGSWSSSSLQTPKILLPHCLNPGEKLSPGPTTAPSGTPSVPVPPTLPSHSKNLESIPMDTSPAPLPLSSVGRPCPPAAPKEGSEELEPLYHPSVGQGVLLCVPMPIVSGLCPALSLLSLPASLNAHGPILVSCRS